MPECCERMVQSLAAADVASGRMFPRRLLQESGDEDQTNEVLATYPLHVTCECVLCDPSMFVVSGFGARE